MITRRERGMNPRMHGYRRLTELYNPETGQALYVSSFGNVKHKGQIMQIGLDRWFETMAFPAECNPETGLISISNWRELNTCPLECGIFGAEPPEDIDTAAYNMDTIHEAQVQWYIDNPDKWDYQEEEPSDADECE